MVGCITPWNFPLLLMTWKLGPALACGNTVVAKPAEFTPITASTLGEISHEAGLPPGVLNIVQGFGPDAAGSAITSHPGVDALSFTGETTTGKAIMRTAAEGLKAVSFELGGKAAALVFTDANLDTAVQQTVHSAYLNQGEVCLATPVCWSNGRFSMNFYGGLRRQWKDSRLGIRLIRGRQSGR